MGPNNGSRTAWRATIVFQSSVRINVGPNVCTPVHATLNAEFQSSVRINVGPNKWPTRARSALAAFQSSVRINVGPNTSVPHSAFSGRQVSILRED